jgi:hypothetical protein
MGLMYPEGSLGKELQRALPTTKVVKTLNTMLFMVMANPGLLVRPASVFLSGNDLLAKAQVRALLADLGWEEAQIEDLGPIETARCLHAFRPRPHAPRRHGPLRPVDCTIGGRFR